MQEHEPVPLNATERVSCCHYTVYCIYLINVNSNGRYWHGKSVQIIATKKYLGRRNQRLVPPTRISGQDRERAKELANE